MSGGGAPIFLAFGALDSVPLNFGTLLFGGFGEPVRWSGCIRPISRISGNSHAPSTECLGARYRGHSPRVTSRLPCGGFYER